MKREIYAKAPIVEAVLDIRIRTNSLPDLETLSNVSDQLYPEKFKQPFRMEVKIEGGDSPTQPSIQQLSTPLGIMYRNVDEKQIFQARVDGYTFNKLAPYDNWGSFSREGRRLWEIYKSIVSIQHIEMISLTYLNELYIPLGAKFEEYFRTYIEVAPEIPQVLNNYSLSFQTFLPNAQGLLSITQGYGIPKKDGFSSVILNIQAYRPFPENENPTEDELWSMFENLRLAKSDAFEACITDAVREMIR